MFIRETYKKIKGKKKKYTQHQLIESIRTPAGPRQHIVLNLGRLSIPKDKWKELANTIEGFVKKQPLLFSIDAEIESTAQHYADRIIKERFAHEEEKRNDGKSLSKRESQHESVDINSLANSGLKTIGAEHVAVNQMKEYGLEKILQDLNFTESQIVYACMLIGARMIHPSSERETARWLQETSGMEELFKKKVKIYDNALHRTAALLWKNHKKIEQCLSEKARKTFSLKETVILYDLTNTYFESSKKGSSIAKHGGKSKEKRNDCPLITLSLVVDEDGFPKQSRIWDGNVSEPKTLEHILDELENEKVEDLFNRDKTIVIDAGIASEENISLIQKKGYKYVAVSRKQSYGASFWDNAIEDQILLSDNKTKLTMKLVSTKEESFLLCHSEAKENKEKAIISRKMEKFEAELEAIKSGLKKKKTQKKIERIMERIGRLKERYRVGNLYSIHVEEEKGIVVNIKFKKNARAEIKKKNIGNYVLRTNRTDLTGETISKIHRSLTTIEDCFEKMKGSLGLRPNFHQRDKSIIAHAQITVLGYHMLAGILKKTKTAKISYNWGSIRNILATHARVTTTMKTEDNHVINIRTCTTPTEKQQKIYKALKIKHTPLQQIHVKIQIKTQRCSVENSGKKNTTDANSRSSI